LGDRVFYLAGGYKYAQWGEGACFLCVPPGCALRPENTGWFAAFGAMQAGTDTAKRTAYSGDGFRFWGSTFDPAGLYRLNAVAVWLRNRGISIEMIRTHVLDLQSHFLDTLSHDGARIFRIEDMAIWESERRGNFLSFDLKGEHTAMAAVCTFKENGVIVDSRGAFVRIGFGMYHNEADVDALAHIIHTI
jgi:selenocysteine lyase/cysteine desulfurase